MRRANLVFALCLATALTLGFLSVYAGIVAHDDAGSQLYGGLAWFPVGIALMVKSWPSLPKRGRR